MLQARRPTLAVTAMLPRFEAQSGGLILPALAGCVCLSSFRGGIATFCIALTRERKVDMLTHNLGYLKQHWPELRQELLQGSYRPQPVRRVEIPKPDGGKRLLGILRRNTWNNFRKLTR